ncbi:MAG: hypothetical protein J6D11_08355 [Clostridia bacterium]|nr:hypothetical protein [Clostridia bacterium]
MKNKDNFITKELFGTSIAIYVLGLIHSIVAATETRMSWGEKVTEFHFDIFAKYAFTAIILGCFFLGMAAIVDYLFCIKNSLCDSNDEDDDSDEEDSDEKTVSEEEIIKELSKMWTNE